MVTGIHLVLLRLLRAIGGICSLAAVVTDRWPLSVAAGRQSQSLALPTRARGNGDACVADYDAVPSHSDANATYYPARIGSITDDLV